MSRALITGVGGFTGRHLAALLVSHGLEVFGVTRRKPSPPVPGVHLVPADLLDRVDVATIVDEIRPSFIFHLASDRDSSDVVELLRRNVGATYHVLEAALRLPRDLGVKVLVVGSAAEYGAPPTSRPFNERDCLRPITPYGVMKVAEVGLAYSYFATHGLATFVARTFNLVGPGEPQSLVCSAMASQIAASEARRQDPVVGVGSLDSERDFVDVRDAVRAYWAIVVQGQPGEIYNVCSGVPVTVAAAFGILGRLAHVPLTHAVEAGRASRSALRSIGDPTRISRELGWYPQIPLELSLADLLEDWRRRYRDEPAPRSEKVLMQPRTATEGDVLWMG